MGTATFISSDTTAKISALQTGTPSTRLTHYPLFTDRLPQTEIRAGRYCLRFAKTHKELDAVLKLRFEVFNLELSEGLDSSYLTERDEDGFDMTCHHLIVIDRTDDRIVGTYRLQISEMANVAGGFYSEGEYEFDDFPLQTLKESVEIGRACVAKNHRNTRVLFLLWQGLAAYMKHNRKQYLFGCCSLCSQDEQEGWRMFRHLRERNYLHKSLLLKAKLKCKHRETDFPKAINEVKIPKLFNSYLRFGAKVCSEPAIDREFKTIDFLVIFDAHEMDSKTYQLFFTS